MPLAPSVAFIGFGPEDDGSVKFINVNQIRHVIAFSKRHCVVMFSEGQTSEFQDDAAEDLLDVVSQLMIGPPAIVFNAREKRRQQP
jgi:hypothetical protein